MIARFFRSDAMSERLGEIEDKVISFPGEFFQLTYNELRDFDGNTIASFDHHADVWRINHLFDEEETAFSDVVLAGDGSPIVRDLESLMIDWRFEVANGDTVLGFAEWRQHQADAAAVNVSQ